MSVIRQIKNSRSFRGSLFKLSSVLGVASRSKLVKLGLSFVIIIFLKKPVGKRFFIVFRFAICKVLSIKVNRFSARALETVDVTRVFSSSDLKFYF